jgi:glycosyl hydrolase family 15/glucodextranase-like protein
MDWRYDSAPKGNVVETAETELDGRGHQDLQLALGFGATSAAALSTARASLGRGFDRVSGAYEDGWHRFLAALKPAPASARPYGAEYDVSVMTLAAHEDKTNRGAFIAWPTMPWSWGTGFEQPKSGVYHAVWSRDLYQIATGLMAAGDTGAAERGLSFIFDKQQRPDGSIRQNTFVDGTPHWDGTQQDEDAFPIVLAWQLHRDDAQTYSLHIKPAADWLVRTGPQTDMDRWENQSGWSPGTIASEIAGLICAADIARKNGDDASAATYEQTVDTWQRKVESWTATTNGPYSDKPYYLRVTKDANPNDGSTYSIGDSGPSAMDERRVVDPSFLELVRLGVKRPDDPTILNTISVVDQQLAVDTPNGRFWHRANFDGYGEQLDGQPWNSFPPDTRATRGRAWPIFSGERGEYNLAAGLPATAQLKAMAGAANEGEPDPRAGLGRPAAVGPAGLHAGRGHAVGDAAGVVARAVRAPGVVDPGRPPDRAAEHRGLPLRADLQLGPRQARAREDEEPDREAEQCDRHAPDHHHVEDRARAGALALAAHRLQPRRPHAPARRRVSQLAVGAVELRQRLADDHHRRGDADEHEHVGAHRRLRRADQVRDQVQPAEGDPEPEQHRADRHQGDQQGSKQPAADGHRHPVFPTIGPASAGRSSVPRAARLPGLTGPAVRAGDRGCDVGLEDIAARAGVHRAVVGSA